MISHTIPYGRSLVISYYGQAGTGGKIPAANMRLGQYNLEINLSPVDSNVNRLNTWVASTIANRLLDDPRSFECDLEPENDTFIVKSTTGDVLLFRLYDDVLVSL